MTEPRSDLDDDLIELGDSDPEECPYLRDRPASLRYVFPFASGGRMFDDLLAAGYRRHGAIFYVPACPGGCRACVPLRVPVASFRPTKSQRRTLRRGDEVFTVEEGPPEIHPEHVALFNRHALQVSGRADAIGVREYVEFLLESAVETVQFVYRHRGELAGVGLLDLGERSASSIYFFWDPELAALSPGTYSALHELRWCQERGLDHYYLGYWIEACPAMDYKARFGPNERLDWERRAWRPDRSE